MRDLYRHCQVNGKHEKILVVSRTKETKALLAEDRAAIEADGDGLPFYETRPNGGTAEMPPEGFNDVHKSIGEWRAESRKLKPGARAVARLASWWQPQPRNPARWVKVYHIDDTVFIRGRSVENIRMRQAAGDVLTQKEKGKLLEDALGM